MRHYGQAVTRMGPVGSGQLTKMVNQIMLAGIIEGLAEGLNFAVRAGLDPGQVAAVLSKGAAQSWQLENRARTMIEGKFDFGFAVDWMRKDSRDRPRRSPAQWRRPPGRRARRPALSAGPGARRPPVGYVEPHPAPGGALSHG